MTEERNEENSIKESTEEETIVNDENAESSSVEQCLIAENDELIAEIQEQKASYAALETENNENVEALQRQRAEFENFRKRTLKEKEELRLSAAGNLLTDLLPVLDNFERALVHADDHPVVEGIKMVQKQMLDILINSGLIIVGVEGEEFDPKIHDGVMQEEKEGFVSNTVAEVLQPGYMFHEKLLRPAMVKVAK